MPAAPSHPVLPPPQADRPGRRHPRRPGCLLGQSRLPREPGRVRPPHRRVARQRPTPAGRPATGDDLTVNELILAYLAPRRGATTSRTASRPRGRGTSGSPIRPAPPALRPHPGRRVRPAGLKAVRQAMIDSGLCRNEVNKRVRTIVRVFKWAVGEELVPPVGPPRPQGRRRLRRGRSDGPGDRAGPAGPRGVRRGGPALTSPARSGRWSSSSASPACGRARSARCGRCDLDTSGQVWVYTPGVAQDRAPRPGADDLPRPQGPGGPPALIAGGSGEYLFSPRESEEERWAEQRRARKTPMTPYQRSRVRKVEPQRSPGLTREGPRAGPLPRIPPAPGRRRDAYPAGRRDDPQHARLHLGRLMGHGRTSPGCPWRRLAGPRRGNPGRASHQCRAGHLGPPNDPPGGWGGRSTRGPGDCAGCTVREAIGSPDLPERGPTSRAAE